MSSVHDSHSYPHAYCLRICALFTISCALLVLFTNFISKPKKKKKKKSTYRLRSRSISHHAVAATASHNNQKTKKKKKHSNPKNAIYFGIIFCEMASAFAALVPSHFSISNHSHVTLIRMLMHGARMTLPFLILSLVLDLHCSLKYPLSYSMEKHSKLLVMLCLIHFILIPFHFFKHSHSFRSFTLTHFVSKYFKFFETFISSAYMITACLLLYFSFSYLYWSRAKRGSEKKKNSSFSSTSGCLRITQSHAYVYLMRMAFLVVSSMLIFTLSLPCHTTEHFLLHPQPPAFISWSSIWNMLGEISIALRGVELCVFFLSNGSLFSSGKRIASWIMSFRNKGPESTASQQQVSHSDETTINFSESAEKQFKPSKKYSIDDISSFIRKDMMYCVLVGMTEALRVEGKNIINPKTDFYSQVTYKGVRCTNHEFKFTEYCPNVFSSLRSFMQISNEEFRESFDPESILNDSVQQSFSTAKGGSFFCFSSDKKYIIKSVTSGEKKTFLRIIKPLYKYVLKNPNTLINYPLGCFKLHGENLPFEVRFMVMRNIFDTPKSVQLDTTFDLKGSFIDRKSKAHEKVKKDSDLKKVFQLDDEQYYELKRQLEKDAEFFQKQNIMDYSLLLGVHKRMKHKRHKKVKEKIDEPFHRRSKNGMLTRDNKYIIYMGIIDILQDYNWNKKTERFLKATFKRRDKHGISSIPSEQYAFRFKKNLLKHFKRAETSE